MPPSGINLAASLALYLSFEKTSSVLLDSSSASSTAASTSYSTQAGQVAESEATFFHRKLRNVASYDRAFTNKRLQDLPASQEKVTLEAGQPSLLLRLFHGYP